MSAEVTTNAVQEQVEAAAQLSAEQQAQVMEEAKKELGLVVKALRNANKETAVAHFLAGMHGLRFINLCRKAGRARSFATGELDRELSWWMGRNVESNLILRTYAAILLLHGDITPPASKASAKDKSVWAELVDGLPPVGHFQKAWASLVDRFDDGQEEKWVLLPGYEEKCLTLYKEVQAKGLKLDDDKDKDSGKVLEKGIATIVREFLIEFMRWKADNKAAEAAAKGEAKEQLEVQAKAMEDKATTQQAVVKSLLEKAQGEAKPETKAVLEKEARDAAEVLKEYRTNLRQLVDQAAATAREMNQARQEALDADKKADKGETKLQKRQQGTEQDTGRNLPWQAQAENAAEKATVKDLADALYNIVAKNAEPENVLYAMLKLHRTDGSNVFKQALAAFGLTWERKSSGEKVPA